MRIILCLMVTIVGASTSSSAYANYSSQLTPQQRLQLKRDYHIVTIAKAPLKSLVADFSVFLLSPNITDAQETLLAEFAGVAQGDRKALAHLVLEKIKVSKSRVIRTLIANYYETLSERERRDGLFSRANLAWNRALNITENGSTPYLTAYAQYFVERNLCGRVMAISIMNNKNKKSISRDALKVNCQKDSAGFQVAHLIEENTGKEVDLPLYMDLGDGIVYMNNVQLTYELISGEATHVTAPDKKQIYFIMNFVK